MIAWIQKALNDIFTERDGTSYCWARGLATIAFADLIWKFHHVTDTAMTSDTMKAFAWSVGGIIASVALKNMTDRDGEH